MTGRTARILAGSLFLVLLLPAAPAQDPSPYFITNSFKGKISCGVAVMGQTTGDACAPVAPDDLSVLDFAAKPGVGAFVFEIQFVGNNAAGPRVLELLFPKPLDEAGTKAWMTKNEGKLVLVPLQKGVKLEGGSFKVEIRVAESDPAPAVAYDMVFALYVSHFYGYAPPENFSAIRGTGQEVPKPAPSDASTVPAAPADRVLSGSVTQGFPPGLAAAGIGGVLAGLAALLLAPRLRNVVWGAGAYFTRLDEDRVLDHPRRALILRIVHAEPGLAVEEVRRRAGIANGAFEYHIRVLQGRRLVHRVAGGGRSRLFPPERAADLAPGAVHPVKERILEAVRRNPGARPTELARELAVPEKTVRYHALWMARAGLLRMETEGAGVRCYPRA